MGYFHEGHLSLLASAAGGNDVVVASIFVNPLQFGSEEDFEVYPRDLKRDKSMAQDSGVTHLFVPSVFEMYPQGQLETTVDVGRIGEICEGRYRPGHFSGVATVCVKLFNIVRPDRAYFGQKDAQQLAVIRQVVRDFNLPLEIVACPTVRDSSGLALSSRNSRLDPGQLQSASVISLALFRAADLAKKGERSASILEAESRAQIAGEPEVRLQYLQVVDPLTFEEVTSIEEEASMVIAAYVGDVRLIDNTLLRPSPDP